MPPTPAVDTAPLTPREAQVLTLAAQGLTDRQIAHRLAISTKTVSTHMFNLRRQLDAANRTHAVVLAAQLGLITITPPAQRQPPTPARPPLESRG